jgi:Fe-S-cluster containining protein
VTSLSEKEAELFRSAVLAASEREEVGRAVANVYRALQDAIDIRRPVCNVSGRCCRFDEFGHRLFVSTLEMASFWRELQQSTTKSAANPGGCPFQINKLCTVHTFRPLGCRIFFCDETATDWQQSQYAAFHDELKRLHERLSVPYFYVEWRAGLAVLIPPTFIRFSADSSRSDQRRP